MSKSYRQGQILNLIRTRPIRTQEELAQELRSLGVVATQVTLSRDIRDLRLVKTRFGYQEWCCAPLPGTPTRSPSRSMARTGRRWLAPLPATTPFW